MIKPGETYERAGEVRTVLELIDKRGRITVRYRVKNAVLICRISNFMKWKNKNMKTANTRQVRGWKRESKTVVQHISGLRVEFKHGKVAVIHESLSAAESHFATMDEPGNIGAKIHGLINQAERLFQGRH